MVAHTQRGLVKALKMIVVRWGPGPFQKKQHHQEPTGGHQGQGKYHSEKWNN